MSDNNGEQSRKRKKYSKHGCQECKRMKVKCDEVKPQCSRCERTSKECFYPVPKAPKTQSKSKKVHKATLEELGSADQDQENHINTNVGYCSSNDSPLSFNSYQKKFNKRDFMDMLDEDITLRIDKAIMSLSIPQVVSQTPEAPTMLLTQLDQSILYNLKSYTGVPYENILETEDIYQIPLKLFNTLKDPQQSRYLAVFFNEFSTVLLPLEPKTGLNPMRDILLKYSLRKNYLFHAILATGARFSYKKTSLDDDQENYSKFMKSTLEMLNDLTAVKNFVPNVSTDPITKDQITKTAEILLLTILILTSDSASSIKQKWRGHLRGAKELLYKAFVLDHFNKSKIMIFCKLWFTSFEILACLTAPRGGTIRDEVEWKALIYDPNNKYELDISHELHLVTKEGFNLVCGYHNRNLALLVSLIDLMKSLTYSSHPEYSTSEAVFKLLSEFKSNQHLSMMKNVPQCAISTYRNSSTGDVQTISWYDICHESNVDAGVLTILTNMLSVPKDNFVVQGIVKKILSRFHVLHYDYDNITSETHCDGHDGSTNKSVALMLLQWPLLVAGLNSISPKDKFEVESIFRLLTTLGSGSSKLAIDKMKKVWNNESIMNADEIDIVTY